MNVFTAKLQEAAQAGYSAPKRTFGHSQAPTFSNGATQAVRMVSEKQVDFINTLLQERLLVDTAQPKYAARCAELAMDAELVTQLTSKAASALITYLFTLPKVAPTYSNFVPADPAIMEVPAGRYAVATDAGHLAFYKVERPETGNWAGHVFVKLMASEEERNLSKSTANAILAKITLAGAAECSKAYGLEIRKCGVCHRKLTNEASRKAGIGPKCAAAQGW